MTHTISLNEFIQADIMETSHNAAHTVRWFTINKHWFTLTALEQANVIK